MRRIGLLAAIVGLASPAYAQGQVKRRDPGTVVNGKVVVLVHVVLRDDETPYYPVAGLQLRFFRSATDSVVIVTDAAGAATALLPPGEYRLVSARDAVWKGFRYSWSIPLVVRAGMLPIDLREPSNSSPRAFTPAVEEATPTTIPAAVDVLPAAASRDVSGSSVAERKGFWIGVGMGVGSIGCEGCATRATGLSGNFSLGGTLSKRVLLGAFFNGWTKSENGVTLTAGTLTAGVRVYPSLANGFFLAGGIGVANEQLDINGFGSVGGTGTGAMLGVGWDIRVGRSVSLTPFFNSLGLEVNGELGNFQQIGLGVTWH